MTAEQKWICPHCRQTGVNASSIPCPPSCPNYVAPPTALVEPREPEPKKDCKDGHLWTSDACCYVGGEWDWPCDCGELSRDFPPDALASPAVVERREPQEREHETLETWRIAALSKDRTRRAIRERVKAGENQMDVADDYGVPLAFVSHLAQWQLFSDPDESPAVVERAPLEETRREFIEKWMHDGHLQTYEDRQRFREEAKALLLAWPSSRERENKP